MVNPGQGQQDLSSDTCDFNKISFLVEQALGVIAGATLVQVKACTNNGGVSPVGTVDVQPLVNLLDGAGTSSPHDILYGLPYARVQGGQNAVICDPAPGDIGVAVFADRDISAVKSKKAQANPGSYRRKDMADGIYLFTVVGTVAPVQFVQFTPDGVNITDKNGNTIVMNADGIIINGVKIDRSQNISAVQKLTTLDTTSLGGGAQAVKLADGSNATKVKAT